MKSSLLASLFLVAIPAFAANINYTLTSGADVVTFSSSDQPSPSSCALGIGCFSITPGNLVIDGAAIGGGVVNFYDTANSGGLTIISGSTLLVNNDGPGFLSLFTGTLASPTLETFTNLQLMKQSFDSPVHDEAFLLNAVSSVTNTPEPASFGLAGLALAGIGFAYKRR